MKRTNGRACTLLVGRLALVSVHAHKHHTQTGKKRRTDDLTIEEQVERFPFLKDAPLEGGRCVRLSASCRVVCLLSLCIIY